MIVTAQAGNATDDPPEPLTESALAILSLIWSEGPISRTALADRTGLAHSSITRLIRILERHDLVRAVELGESTGGRPPILLAFNKEAGVILAVDLGSIVLRGAIYDVLGNRLDLIERPYTGLGTQAIHAQLTKLADELVASCARLGKRPLAIAISVPGTVDLESATIVDVTNLDLRDYAVGSLLGARHRLPVLIEHDTIAAAYAERYYGAGRESENMIYITVSQGIGAGILLQNHIHRGESGLAGEIGHVTIVRDGPLCLCGRRGCLEAVAGAQAIIRSTRQALYEANGDGTVGGEHLSQLDPATLTIEEITQAAAQNDPVALPILVQAADYIAQAIGSLTCILDINTVIVGGEVGAAGETFLAPLRASLPRYQFISNPTVVLPAVLNQDASIRGVSMLAVQQVFGLSH